MNLASWLLLGAVVLWLIAALVHIARHKGGCCGSDGCCGDCAHCVACGCKGKRKICGAASRENCDCVQLKRENPD